MVVDHLHINDLVAQMRPHEIRSLWANGRCSDETLRKLYRVLRGTPNLSIFEEEILRACAHQLRTRNLLTPAALDLSDEANAFIAASGEQSSPADCSIALSLHGMDFDIGQAAAVTADVSSCQIINAPPGTGKTRVACGRIAWLIDQGVYEHQIQVFSFTRAAIAELRNRMAILEEHRPGIGTVEFSTLDRKAWKTIQAFRGTGRLAFHEGYDATVRAFGDLLNDGDTDLIESLSEIRHVIIDEAQDVVGLRAEVYCSLIARLPKDTGITVLCDEAQAIFGFSERRDVRLENFDDIDEAFGLKRSFVDRLRQLPDRSFIDRTLECVHRTAASHLKTIFVDVRANLLERIQESPLQAPALVVHHTRLLANNTDAPERDPDLLFLHRQRVNVFEHASLLAQCNEVFRVRLGGVDYGIAPWVAVLLYDNFSDRLTKAEFDSRWPRVEALLATDTPSAAAAWAAMHAQFGDTRASVDVELMRQMLSRSSPREPFGMSELGFAGPIISTIHGSKGREADRVVLHLPQTNRANGNAEEARVWFVGATRARSALWVRDAFTTFLPKNARTVRVADEHNHVLRGKVEMGHTGDVVSHSPVSTRLHKHVESAMMGQSWLAASCGNLNMLVGHHKSALQYALRVNGQNGPDIGLLSDDVVTQARVDLWRWGPSQLVSPDSIEQIPCIGARTVVMAPDDLAGEEIHDAFRKSGFWLAPVVFGMPTLTFHKQ